MSEPQTPQAPPPPPPTPPPPAGGGTESSNRGPMIVLSYLWILALIPLLVEKEDREVQWHAKHGLVILVAELLLFVALTVLQMVPVIGTIIGCALLPILWIGVLIVRILCIVKGIGGTRFLIPGVSQYADRF